MNETQIDRNEGQEKAGDVNVARSTTSASGDNYHRIHLRKKGGKKRGTILFIHGSSSSLRVFDPVMDSPELPYSLVSFDLPGHGRSYRSDEEDAYSLQRYKEVTLEIAEGIGDDILLVGNSLGGHIAIEAANGIERLKGLVTLGTPPVKKPLNLSEAFLPNPVLNYYFTAEVTEAQLDEAMQEAVQNKEAIPVLREDFRICDPHIRSAIGDQIAEGNAFGDEHHIFSKLGVPRFILQGDRDPTVSLEYLRKLKNESEGIVDIEVLDNCGHYPSIERTDEFINKLADIASKVF